MRNGLLSWTGTSICRRTGKRNTSVWSSLISLRLRSDRSFARSHKLLGQAKGTTGEKATMYRILIDCTSTLDAAFQSGIQRVVRNLIDHGPTAMTGKASVEAFGFGTKQMFQASKKLYEKRHPASQHGGRWVIDRELSTC